MCLSAGFAGEDVGQNMLKATEAGALVTLGTSCGLEVVALSRLLQRTWNAASVADNLEHHVGWLSRC